MVKSQATTMKIRNKKGRIHAAFSAFDTPPGPFATTLRSLVTVLLAQINPLDKYCLGLFEVAKSPRRPYESRDPYAAASRFRRGGGHFRKITQASGYGSLLSQGRHQMKRYDAPESAISALCSY